MPPSSSQQLSSGQNALREGRISDALAQLQALVAQEPQNADALHFLGLALFENGDGANAIDTLKQSIAIAEKPVFWGNFGSVYRSLHRPKEAEEAYRRAVTLKPDYIGAWINLGKLFQEQKRLNDTVLAYKQAIALDPNNADVLCFLALTYSEQGDLPSAEASFRRAIALRPAYAEAHNDLGLLLRTMQRTAEAEECAQRAIMLKPNCAEFHCNFGVLLADQMRLDEAEAAYSMALQIRPAYPEASNNLGSLYKTQQRLAEAEKFFRQALTFNPDYATAQNNLAVLLQEQGRRTEAEEIFRVLVDRHPDHAIAHNNYGVLLREMKRPVEAEAMLRQALVLKPEDVSACNNLALVLQDAGRLEEAETFCRRAVKSQPNFADAWGNLGLILKEQKRFDEAEQIYRQALEINPDQADIHNNLGVLCAGQKRFDEAEKCYHRAIELNPLHADAHNNLGVLMKDQKQVDLAELSYKKAISLRPDYADAHHNYALSLLRQGRFAEGLPEFEWRYAPGMTDRAAPVIPPYDFPMWRGEPLSGKTILMQPEQAYGDEIQYVRYAKFLKDQGARVWLLTRKALFPLMNLLPWANRILQQGEEISSADCDYWTFTMSLPYRAQTRMETIPAPVPYFVPDEKKVAGWQQWIAERAVDTKARKIGLVWAGNPVPPNRSLHLSQLAGLNDCTNATFVSLQMGDACQQMAEQPLGKKLLDAGSLISDFSDTAALMTALDLIITIDSAPAHLAGALNRPVWTLVQWLPDWRWFMDREDSPWYPSMRLNWQTQHGDWSKTVEKLTADLKRWLSA